LDISSTKKKEILAKSELSASYEIIDIREAKLILRMHINRNKETGNIILSQYTYIGQMLEHFHMTEYKPASILLPPEIMLTNKDSHSLSEMTKEMEDISYHKTLGSLI